jgi:uncharacterized protein (DUF927 family)
MKLLFALLVSYALVFAQTPYILTKFKSAYPLVKIHTDKVPSSYKSEIKNIIKEYTQELNINTNGNSERVLGIFVTRVPLGKNLVLKVELFVREHVRRLDDNEEVFALTYQKADIFEVKDIEEDLIDSVENLLEEFSEQYIEDNE